MVLGLSRKWAILKVVLHLYGHVENSIEIKIKKSEVAPPSLKKIRESLKLKTHCNSQKCK